jgi:hypothetical protein
MGSVGKKIKKVVKKVMRPKVLLPLAAIALGGPALMGGLKGAALGAGAAPGSLMASGMAKSALASKATIVSALKSGIGALAKKVAMSPITKGVIGGLKNPFSVPGALTYGGLGALGMMLGSKGGDEKGSDPINRAALNQANYDMMRMYGQNAGYTNEDINTIYGPLGQMMGGEYTEVAADPNQRRRVQYPGTNYPIYTTQGAADGGRIGLMGGGGAGDLKYAVESFIRDFPEFENLGNEELYKEMEKRGYLGDRDEMYLGGRVGYADGDIVGTEQMDDEELQRQLIMDALFPEGSPGANEDAIADQMYNMQMQEMMNPNMGRANGGRIGLEGGGMSNMMMASAPDPMAERMDMLENLALDMYKKPLEELKPKEIELLEGMIEEMDHGYAVGGRVGFMDGGMGFKDVVERFAEGLSEKEFIEFEMMSPEQQMEVMKRAGVMRDDMNTGGRVNRNMGGIMNAGSIPQTMQNPVDMNMQLDGRGGGFIPMGTKPRADDVPAMLSKDEFVMTRDAVKGLGGGDVNVGAQKMYDLMNQLEAKV